VKIRDKVIKWDIEMTEARRTLDWEKQLALSIDPEAAAKIHNRTGQHSGNNVPCTMCGGACVYMMLPQQKKYENKNENLQQIE
jgi:phosphomethylpyrimidine synthase